MCKALELQEDNAEALEMKQDLEQRATLCKNRVSLYNYRFILEFMLALQVMLEPLP